MQGMATHAVPAYPQFFGFPTLGRSGARCMNQVACSTGQKPYDPGALRYR